MKCFLVLIIGVVLLGGFTSEGFAQNRFSLRGKVLDSETRTSLEFASVAMENTGRGCITDSEGCFVIKNIQKGTQRIVVSYLGYLNYKLEINLQQDTLINIELKKVKTHLDELIVIAQRGENRTSSTQINRNAIEHVQPSSFTDILELLPGGISQSNSLVEANLASFREASEGTLNSSLGTAFVIDGMQMTNDAQLQTVVGAYGEEITEKNTTGRGIDMRMMPTDDIESVEVISGVSSVEYGEVTNSLVKVKRMFRKTPLSIRVKANPKGKLISIGKGIALNSIHTLNTNLSYLKHVPDPRNKKEEYSRLTVSLRHKYSNSEQLNPMVLKTTFDYTGSFDDDKTDVEQDLQGDVFKNSYNQYRLGSSLDWYVNTSKWFTKLSYVLNSSYAHQESIIDKATSGGTVAMPIGFEQGVRDGVYLPSSYRSLLKVDGKPLLISSKIKAFFAFNLTGLKHELLLGSEWTYNKNLGEGRQYNINLPTYPSIESSIPRKSKDIPALEKLSFFLGDNFTIPIQKNLIEVNMGLRASSALNVGSRYYINNRFYLDPRINISWILPKFTTLGEVTNISFNLSYGVQTKFPGLSYLYPELNYHHSQQLNFYSQNEILSRVNFKTSVSDPTNYNLKPSINRKKEIGVNIKIAKAYLQINYFDEEMTSGFRNTGYFEVLKYRKYDATSVSTVGLTKPPKLSDFKWKDEKEFKSYNYAGNTQLTVKKGIEYQLDLGMIKEVHSRVSLNGAWYKTKYDISGPEYRTSNVVLNGEKYPYVGIYNWDKGRTYQQFNSTLRINTQVSKLGLIFTTAIQSMWFTSRKNKYNNGMPSYYEDMNGQIKDYKPKDTEDYILTHLYKKPYANAFDEFRDAIAVDLNLKVQKSIGGKMKLAFYVNSLLDYYPDFHRRDGFLVRRRQEPRFGMELNINL